ncbi:MAG: nucleotide exchange factor GrpE [Candidatus Altarchaeaceae archaeon]
MYYQQVLESKENFIINIEPVEVNKENINLNVSEEEIKVEIFKDKEKKQKDFLNFPLKNKNFKIDLNSVNAKLENKILTISAKLLKKEEKNIEIFDEKENIIKQKEKEIEELNDKYLRLLADLENLRKFWNKRENELKTYGNIELIKKLLPILDAMEVAFKNIKTENLKEEDIKGIKMIFENFKKILFDSGLEEIKSLNEKFDPRYHEAYIVENNDKFPDETIIEEFQKGYKYKDIVLRTAKVKVCKRS